MQNRSNLIGVRESLVEAEEKKSSAAAAFPATSELRKVPNVPYPNSAIISTKSAGRIYDNVTRDDEQDIPARYCVGRASI
jgi:hypothetical protein